MSAPHHGRRAGFSLALLVAFLAALRVSVGARAGLLDGFGQMLGLNAGIFGAIVGMAIVGLAVMLLAGVMKVEGPVMILLLMAVLAFVVLLGLWPTWTIVLLALLGAVLAWQAFSTGAAGRQGEA